MTETLRSPDGRVIVPGRMRSRRVEVHRDRGRRRLHRLIAVGSLAIVVVVAWLIARSPLLAVNAIVVSGSSHVSRADVETATRIRPGTAMMDVSIDDAERRLEALPWVERAQVTRHWPHRVDVKLVDRRPIAQVGSPHHYALVDADGRVLATTTKADVEWPILAGFQAPRTGESLGGSKTLLDVVEAMPPDLRPLIRSVSRAKGGSPVLALRSGGTIRLGSGSELTAKFASVSTMLEHLGTLRSGCTLDVAVPSTPLVSPGNRCG